MKLQNNTKNRNATANEIAKRLIIDKLEIVGYFTDNNEYQETYSEEFIEEIYRHINKHCASIKKNLNPNDNNIDIFY
jgi:DNA-directed RNA polymerase specialized sigma subunit